jgi:hypothetical protein
MTFEQVKNMTPTQIKHVAALYQNETLATVLGKRFTTHGQLPDNDHALAHAKWMCEEIALMDNPGKAMRWLCFVQGVLWMTGRRSITEMRDDNR